MVSMCAKCGELNENQTSKCRICGDHVTGQATFEQNQLSNSSSNGLSVALSHLPSADQTPQFPPACMPSLMSTDSASNASSLVEVLPAVTLVTASPRFRNEVEGEVIWAGIIQQEPPDWSFVRAISSPVIFLGCLSMPFLLICTAFRHDHYWVALFLGVTLIVVAKVLISRSVMSFLYLKAQMFPSPGSRKSHLVPVQYFRVRTKDKEEKSIRIKGELDSSRAGHIIVGDQMVFWGKWKGGTLHAKRARNLVTNAWSVVKADRPWLLIFVLVIVALLSCSLVTTGGRGGPSSPTHTQP